MKEIEMSLLSRAEELKDMVATGDLSDEYDELYHELMEKQNDFSETYSRVARSRFFELWPSINSERAIEKMAGYNDIIEGFYGFDVIYDLPMPIMPDYEPQDFSGGGE